MIICLLHKLDMEVTYFYRGKQIERIPTKREWENQIIEESKTGVRFPHILSSKVLDDSRMEIVCKNALSEKVHSRVLTMTQEQWAKLQKDWLLRIGEVIPDMSAADREYLLSGITPEEWAERFP